MRMRNVTIGRIAALMFVLALALPITSQAGVFWDEDFENHLTPNWDTGACGVNMGWSPASPQDGCNPYISTNWAHNMTHSLLSDFSSAFPYRSDGGTGIGTRGTYIDRFHQLTDDVWVRFYWHGVNFVSYSGSVSKLFYNKTNDGVDLVTFGTWYGGYDFTPTTYNSASATFCPTTNRLDTACNWWPNLGSNRPLNNGGVYCVETHINHGTVGRSDGIVEVWVDGQQTTRYTGVAIRSSGGQYNHITLYTQAGDGLRYIDNFAVGNTRIGCSGLPSSNITPPAAPTGLTVR